MNFTLTQLLLLPILLLSACKHPLEIDGQGDIVERNRGARGCALEEFIGGGTRCTDNEVFADESARYQALPRRGWLFSHWQGCFGAEADICSIDYVGAWAALWDEQYSDKAMAPLKAVFIEDRGAPQSATYLGSRFGSEGSAAFGALLETLVSSAGYYRDTRQLASTRADYDREPRNFLRNGSGLLYTAAEGSDLDISGWAAADSSLLALVDMDTSDEEISLTWLTPELDEADQTLLNGTYYCGRISTDGAGEFSRLVAAGNGSGVIQVLEDRRGITGQAGVSYRVASNGVMTLGWGGISLTGSLDATGEVFVSSQLQSNRRGAAVCIRSNEGNSLANVAGSYLGTWFSLQPVTAVTEILVNPTGDTAESVHVDSSGGRAYSLGRDFMLVNWDGKLATSANHGAISSNGRAMFIVYTNPNKFPTLVYYTRKTG